MAKKDISKKIIAEWEKSEKDKRAEYYVNIIIGIILLFIWGRLPNWFSFLTGAYSSVLVFLYIGSVVTVLLNLSFLMLKNITYKQVAKSLLNIYNAVVMYVVYKVFPFDFSSYQTNWSEIIGVVLIVLIVLTLLAALVEMVKAILGSSVVKKSAK